ncbi:MAG TPA: GNAT family N-acetyltransferase [Actinomycetota bacterium]|nr:GNAT family N-acetyltransferase [Actinomycetota bacterium]
MRVGALPRDTPSREAAARILVDSFREHWPRAWPTVDDALKELDGLPVGQAAFVGDELVGVAGAIPTYDGNVWEVHPLAVAEPHRGRGIGRALLDALESLAAAAGASTLWVGSDDEDEMTTVGGRDLYPDILGSLAAIEDVNGHPYRFYMRCGFSLAGVVPDANGPGKHDILLAKRVRRT